MFMGLGRKLENLEESHFTLTGWIWIFRINNNPDITNDLRSPKKHICFFLLLRCVCPTLLGNAVSLSLMWLWSLAGSVSLTAVMQRKTTDTTSHFFYTLQKKNKNVSLTCCLFTQEMDQFKCLVHFLYHFVAGSVRLNSHAGLSGFILSKARRRGSGHRLVKAFLSLKQFAATLPEEGTTCVDSGACQLSIPTNPALSSPVGLASHQRDGRKKKRVREREKDWSEALYAYTLRVKHPQPAAYGFHGIKISQVQ